MRTARGCGHCGCGREPSATWGRRVPRTAARTDLGPIQPSSPAPAGGEGPIESSRGPPPRPRSGLPDPAVPLFRATRLPYCRLRTCVLDPDAAAIARSKTDAPLTPKVNEPPHAWGPQGRGLDVQGKLARGGGLGAVPGRRGSWVVGLLRHHDFVTDSEPIHHVYHGFDRKPPTAGTAAGPGPTRVPRRSRTDLPYLVLQSVSVRGERHWVESHATYCPGHSE